MNLSDINFYRYFSFDLSIQFLNQHYPKVDINQSWSDIAKYMKSNGFSHRQYSGYLSLDKMNESQMVKAAMDMYKALPWLSSCAEKFDSTAIIEEQTFDLNETYKQNVGKKIIVPVKKILTVSDPPQSKGEDLILPKDEKQDFVEMSLTSEQFKKLTEAGINLTVMVDSKDLQKASEILNPTKTIQQAKPHKPKR